MKRIFDLLASLTALLLLLPVLLIVSLCIMIFIGRPILFSQDRPGKGEQIFKMYKFRSMSNQRDSNGNLLPDEQRLGRFGKLLRSTSLDELPALFNVIKGDMSLVGPRPLLVEYLPLYNPQQAKRHSVKPGITGWAQVNGRNAISWQKKFELDVEYVKNRSFALDLKILFMTVQKVFKREGITQAEHVSSEKFNGSN